MKTSLSGTLLAVLGCSVTASSSRSRSLYSRADNGLALTPPMGWNTYNHYACIPNETVVLSNAQAMVDLGLSDLGYYYVTPDCGWTVSHRTDEGKLTWNQSLFPSGFPALGKRIHDLGLGFGVYSDAGIQTCMNGLPNQTGSLNHEATDADTFAYWGADMLKYDNCYSVVEKHFPNVDYAPPSPIAPRYHAMATALQATGRSILFAVCEWGVDFPSTWAPAIGNTWRIANDIIPAWRSIARIVNQVIPQTSFAGPGRWLDLDMLEIGNTLFSVAEEQTHMSLWSIIKSPLIIGAALRDEYTAISNSSLDILRNQVVIGFNQDSKGVPASFRRRWTEAEYEVWSGPLSGNRTVAALVNWADESRDLVMHLPDIGLQRAQTLKNVWHNSKAHNNVLTWYGSKVSAHGTMLLEIEDGGEAGTYDAEYFAVSGGNRTTFQNVYGVTTSNRFTLSITFDPPQPQQASQSHTFAVRTSAQPSIWTFNTIPAAFSNNTMPPATVSISLNAIHNNTVSIESSLSLRVRSIYIDEPEAAYFPSTSFALTGTATRDTCHDDLCKPVGSKIGNITATSGARISIPPRSASATTSSSSSISTSTAAGTEPSTEPTSIPRYVELDFTNNDIAFSSAFGAGSNTRNLTLAVNGVATRVELPLSGRSSELFSPGRGWEDTGTFGVLLDGWYGPDSDEADVVEVSNAGGAGGTQPFGADFVGLRLY